MHPVHPLHAPLEAPPLGPLSVPCECGVLCGHGLGMLQPAQPLSVHEGLDYLHGWLPPILTTQGLVGVVGSDTRPVPGTIQYEQLWWQ